MNVSLHDAPSKSGEPSPAPFRDHAPQYAATGQRVFPLAPGDKPPLEGSRGHLDATTDATKVARWAAETPTANIGLAPGPSGLLVIDIDGPETETAARRLGLLAEPTYTVKTRRGQHLYFRRPSGFRHIGNLYLGPERLEVKCDAGYVVMAGSVLADGTVYSILDGTPPIDLPPDALDAIAAAVGAETHTPAPTPSGFIYEHFRNVVLFRLAVRAWRAGWSVEGITTGLTAENAARCRPPLDADEIAKVITSATRYPRCYQPPPWRVVGPDGRELWERRVIGSRLDVYAQAVLHLVATYDLDGIGAGCVLRQKALARRVPCSMRTLQRTLAYLRKKELVVARPRWDEERGQRDSDELRVNREKCAALPQRDRYAPAIAGSNFCVDAPKHATQAGSVERPSAPKHATQAGDDLRGKEADLHRKPASGDRATRKTLLTALMAPAVDVDGCARRAINNSDTSTAPAVDIGQDSRASEVDEGNSNVLRKLARKWPADALRASLSPERRRGVGR